MSKPSATAIRALPQLGLSIMLGFAMGCSIDARPSLGRYEPAELPIERSPGSGGMSAAGANPTTDGGNASGPVTTITMASSDGGAAAPNAQTSIVPRDAAAAVPLAAPDAGGSACRESTYLATLACTIDTVMSVAVFPTTATTQTPLKLRRSSQGVLALASSNLSFDYNGFMLAGDLAGELDCATKVFHADIVNGVLAATLIPIPSAFSGTVDGTLDQVTNTLAGAWSFTAAGTGSACIGTWSAALQP